jgi:predicted transcriptional regulator
MRTTIELSDAHRAKLLELAAERGARGFSELVREAIDQYLASNAARRDRVRAALAVLGTMPAREADALEASARKARASWR